MLKAPGRVGDSPLIGCGTYAADALGACSCTGLGEAIIKATLARQALELLRDGREPKAAAEEAVKALLRYGGDGGLILVDARGRVGHGFNTRRMAVAWIDADGREGAGFAK
jgi:beta-aspartyl-peptidase (threonine type)